MILIGQPQFKRAYVLLLLLPFLTQCAMLRCGISRRDDAVAHATKEHPFVNSLGMKFVPVPGTHILMCLHETRNVDYAAYAAGRLLIDDTWRGEMQAAIRWSGEPQDQHPVVAVSHRDAQAFCRWLSVKEGKTYRLPTDAEWSAAVGLTEEAGETPEQRHHDGPAVFPWGSYYPPKPEDGNYRLGEVDDGYEGTAPVMSFRANKHGIHDLGGNVTEWCLDWWDDARKERVLRGITWFAYDRGVMHSSYRSQAPPTRRSADIGFRCVLVVAAASSL
jgi:formylglycine-generating enzyme required for sulfatase activity